MIEITEILIGVTVGSIFSTICVGTLLVILEVQHRKTQRDLLNRLMSKDFTNYATGTRLVATPPRKPIKKEDTTEDSGEPELVDIPVV